MKILLVGGTGVISSEVMHLSLQKSNDVYIMNRGNRMHLIPKNVKHLKVDIRNNPEKAKQIINDIFFDVVVDFLCYTKEQLKNSISIFKDNCKQFVFISSIAVYKPLGEVTTCTEDSPKVNPLWKYSIDKVECEKSLIELCKASGIEYTIVRPSVTYGNTRIPYGLMPLYGYHWTLIARILHDKAIPVWNNGENFTHMTRVEDFAVGMVELLGNPKAYGEAFHIVGEEKYTWNEVLLVLEKLLNKKIERYNIGIDVLVNEFQQRKGEIEGGRSVNLICDNSKIKKIAPGFKQTIGLEEGMKKTLDYYKDNNYINGIDYAFDAKWDKVILKSNSKENKASLKENLIFIDYLEQGKIYDRYIYLVNKYYHNFFVKNMHRLFILISRILKRLE